MFDLPQPTSGRHTMATGGIVVGSPRRGRLGVGRPRGQPPRSALDGFCHQFCHRDTRNRSAGRFGGFCHTRFSRHGLCYISIGCSSQGSIILRTSPTRRRRSIIRYIPIRNVARHAPRLLENLSTLTTHDRRTRASTTSRNPGATENSPRGFGGSLAPAGGFPLTDSYPSGTLAPAAPHSTKAAKPR